MQDKVFIDTNIWLYSFMEGDDLRKEAALSIISKENAVLSTQVINEICVNLLKKTGYKEDDIAKLVENIYDAYIVVTIDKKIILTASRIRGKYVLSYWDSLIVASALESGCNFLYSEDLQSDQVLERRLQIVNPFRVKK